MFHKEINVKTEQSAVHEQSKQGIEKTFIHKKHVCHFVKTNMCMETEATTI